MSEFWPEIALGLPCVAMTVAARAVFADGDTWPHLVVTIAALLLLTAYVVAWVRPPLPSRRSLRRP